MTQQEYDVVVVGAGPAGISAALEASSHKLKTLLLDEQARPGGQIYRNITAVSSSVAALLGPDYRHGKGLTDRLKQSSVEHCSGAMVWDIAPDLTVTAQREGKSFRVRASQLIVATGAMERPTPIPGWTLPGVMNAGAAQIALKTSAAVPSGRVILAGAGPLLLLVACQLLDAGVKVGGVVETSPRANQWRALRHLPAALMASKYLAKGARMLWRLRQAGIPMFTAATDLKVEGRHAARALVFTAGGKEHRIEADVVLLHHGVVPNTQVSRLLKVDHVWDTTQLAWRPKTDAWGETSLRGFRVAGDGGGISGALAAELHGALAALGAARAMGQVSDGDCDDWAEPIQKRLAQQLRIRPFLDALYRPPEWLSDPADATIVCRCEEVTAGRIREMARLGCQGPNQTKFFSRCGMGPCQGRMCGLAVTQILSAELGREPADVGSYHIRSPIKPVPLASIAALAESVTTGTSLKKEEA